MKDHIVPLLKDEDAKSFMETLEKSQLKPYSEEERKSTDEKVEKILEEKKSKQEELISKEIVKKIFDYGALYQLVQQKPDKWFSGQFPTDDYDKAIDYVYRLLIENERDEECLKCQRYHSKSCEGTINRGRETITDGNRCAAFKGILHVTLGVYTNGQYKYNVVRDEDLENHIDYNKTFRFGRLLYVDGKRVYNGCVKEECLERYDKIAEEFFTTTIKDIDKSKPTIPYE